MRNGRARKCGARDCCLYKQQTSALSRTALHALARKGTGTDWEKGEEMGRGGEEMRKRATVVAR